jgi:type IV secretory pathway TrbL component
VSRSFTHETKASEVACLALGHLILLITREVEVAEGCTRSGHQLLELLLFLVPKMVLLLVIALAVVIPLSVVVLVGGGVELLPLGAVGDEVGGVATLEATPRRSPPLLMEPLQSSELSHQ